MEPTAKLGPFTTGINNRAREFALPVGAVRDAVNVDVDLEGRFRRRRGQSLIRSGTTLSSLWATRDESRAFYKDGSQLYEFFGDAAQSSLVASNLVSLARVAYIEMPGRGIVFSDGVTIKRIVGTVVKPIGLAAPQGTPITVAATGGSLPQGRYLVACSFMDALGEESGLTSADVAIVQANGKISVVLPQPIESQITSVLVYVSAVNGETLYLSATVPVGVTSLQIVLPPSGGRVPTTRFMQPLPAGDLLAFHHGRTYSHRDGVVSYTDPYSGQHNPAGHYMRFAVPVTILHATSYGLFIVADQTYLLTGEPIEGNLKVVNPITAVRGTLALFPDTEEAMWFTPQGLAVTNNGNVELIQQDNVNVSQARRGASIHREIDGLRQNITSLENPSQTKGGANAWYSATLVSGEVRNEF